MSNPILSKIELLRDKFFNADENDKQQMLNWEQAVKRAILADKLKDHPIIKDIHDRAAAKIAECNELLLQHRGLTEIERVKIFERRDAFEWFVALFDVGETIKQVEAAVDANLKAAEENGL